jgi:hypothetical protein
MGRSLRLRRRPASAATLSSTRSRTISSQQLGQLVVCDRLGTAGERRSHRDAEYRVARHQADGAARSRADGGTSAARQRPRRPDPHLGDRMPQQLIDALVAGIRDNFRPVSQGVKRGAKRNGRNGALGILLLELGQPTL